MTDEDRVRVSGRIVILRISGMHNYELETARDPTRAEADAHAIREAIAFAVQEAIAGTTDQLARALTETGHLVARLGHLVARVLALELHAKTHRHIINAQASGPYTGESDVP